MTRSIGWARLVMLELDRTTLEIGGILVLFLGLSACGGAVKPDASAGASGGTAGAPPSNTSDPESDAGAGASSSGGPDGGGSVGESGGSVGESGGSIGESGGAESGTAGAAGRAGGGESTAVHARPKSGTRFCLDDRDCNGLTCTASMDRVQTACLAPCESDLDCKLSERCFAQPTIPSSCFQRCVSPEDCDYQFDCADYYRTGDYLCLPSDWVRYWLPTMP